MTPKLTLFPENLRLRTTWQSSSPGSLTLLLSSLGWGVWSFPTKSFALSECVSPLMNHFQELDKSLLLGLRRGSPLPATLGDWMEEGLDLDLGLCVMGGLQEAQRGWAPATTT